MGRFSSLMLALLLGVVSAVALASCGGGSDAKLLPGTTANQIESNLDQVQALVQSGDCVGAEDAVAEVSAEVEELNDVAGKLKSALQEGTGRLSEVVSRCDEESEEEAEQAAEADVEAEEELEAEELEAEEGKAEKAQEKAEKQEQKVEEKAEAAEEEVEEGNLPPQSEGKGKAKGHEEAVPPPAAEPTPEEAESGGVSPGVGVE
jgi:hypothetical protein